MVIGNRGKAVNLLKPNTKKRKKPSKPTRFELGTKLTDLLDPYADDPFMQSINNPMSTTSKVRKTLDGIDLQSARKAASERFLKNRFA